MAGIKITTQVLTSTAEKVRNLNTKLDQDLADCNSTMNSLESTWQSDAATDIRAAMNALKPRFEEYKRVIDSYAKFLDMTAQSFEATEQTVQTNAGQFR